MSDENDQKPSENSLPADLSLSVFSEDEQKALLDMIAYYRGEKLSPESLGRVVKFAQKQVREKEKEELRELESSLAPKLKPYEDKIAAVELQIREANKNLNLRVEALRAEKQEKIEKSRMLFAEILKEYNPIRKSFGLKERTMFSSSRKRGDKKHKYEYEFKDNVMILIIDGTHRETIDISTKIRVKTISEILSRHGISDETGGRSRGIVTQIKLRLAKIRVEEKKSETFSDLNSDP